MTISLTIVALLALATFAAFTSRRLRIPYTVALVLAGLALGSTALRPSVHLTKDLLYAVFLPGLVFEAAFHLPFRRFWRNKFVILALAIPGVVAVVPLGAAMLAPAFRMVLPGGVFPFAGALVLMAALAATDPIAVIALFKTLGVPPRLGTLVEGESLINDGTGAVLFGLVLASVVHGHFSVSEASLEFVRVVGLGLFVGAVSGAASSWIFRLVDDPMIEITVTTVAGYGSFLVAEHFHGSGVIATLVAGMLCGNDAAKKVMSPSTLLAVGTFWEYVTFALNSIVFLLIGAEIRVAALREFWLPILVGFVVITLARALVVGAIGIALSRHRERLSAAWGVVLTWGGIRGGLSMVLVLGMPASFPFREMLETTTFGIVALSVVLQGSTMPFLLRRLGVSPARADDDVEHERAHARLIAAHAALAEVTDLAARGVIDASMAATLRTEYEADRTAASEKLAEFHGSGERVFEEKKRAMQRHLLLVQREAVGSAARSGAVAAVAAEHFVREIDAALVRGHQPRERDDEAVPHRDGAGSTGGRKGTGA